MEYRLRIDRVIPDAKGSFTVRGGPCQRECPIFQSDTSLKNNKVSVTVNPRSGGTPGGDGPDPDPGPGGGGDGGSGGSGGGLPITGPAPGLLAGTGVAMVLLGGLAVLAVRRPSRFPG